MKVLVCGGRNFKDYFLLCSVLDYFLKYDDLIIINGGATGADSFSSIWAEENGIKHKQYFAQWEKYGKTAGPIRNKLMLETEKPDLVIAFDGGRGTQHMIKIAKQAKVKVIEIKNNDNEQLII